MSKIFKKIESIGLYIVCIGTIILFISMLIWGIGEMIEISKEGKQYKCLEPYAKDYCLLNGYKFKINPFAPIDFFQCEVPSENPRGISTVESFLYNEEELRNCGVLE